MKSRKGPLDLNVLTGLSQGQRAMLVMRCRDLLGDVAKSGGRPPVIGLYRSLMLVVCLMRKNVTQEFAGAIFGVSQSTVSRRWDLLRPLIRRAVASFVPDPRAVLGAGTALVDGTIAPTWDWKHIPDLFSQKENMAGMNIQVAASLTGQLAAVGPFAVHGARHDEAYSGGLRFPWDFYFGICKAATFSGRIELPYTVLKKAAARVSYHWVSP
jgi:Helix-turn-helix of DDE superfamily endonuclease